MLRTQEQQKKICTGCPLAKTADLIGDSCTLLLVRDLLTGPKRFSEFESSLHGISTRTLSNKLKLLEEKGLLAKDVSGTHSQYSLTAKGRGLETIARAMTRYGQKFLS